MPATSPTPRFAAFPLVMLLLAVVSGAGHTVEGAASTPLRVNCGGGTVTDKKTGIVWVSDKDFIVKGRKYRFPIAPKSGKVANPPPADVYGSVRRQNVVYRFPKLKNGLYQLRLHFMDGKRQAMRGMDFWVEGELLVQNLSVRDAAGGVNRGYVYEAIVEVKDGNGLDLRGTRGHGDDVFLSALEILPAPKGSTPTRPVDSSAHAPADLAVQLRTFAQGPVRLAWARTEVEEDFYMAGSEGILLGFDTEDGKGERVILGNAGSYARPILTPDGQQVVYTDQQREKCFAVRFDGSDLREIAGGYASDVWQDPRTSRTWVYVRTGWRETKSTMVRYDLSDPKVHEEVWTKSATGQPQIAYFQLSGDGAVAADGFPWPLCGLADVAAGDLKMMGKGCWPSVAPDTSHRTFIFNGGHTSVQFFDEPDAPARAVNLATVPGWIGRKLYHPRWTNDARYITATAPQWMPETELWLGRFDAGYTRIESWFRITYNHTADFFGDAWFAHARPVMAPGAGAPVSGLLAGPATDGVPAGQVFVWENERAKNAIVDAQGKVVRTWSARYDGAARPDRFYGADIRRGALVPDEDAGAALGNAMAEGGDFTLLMDLNPHEKATGKGGVVAFLGAPEGRARLVVEQRETGLVAGVEGADGQMREASLGGALIGEGRQVVVVCKDQRLTAYANGMETATLEMPKGSPAWSPSLLVFGRDAKGQRAWSGELENIRFFNRALTLEEIQALHGRSAKVWAARQPASRVVVEAELLQASEPDDVATIAPYVRSLGENVYRVKKVVSGELKETDIIVLQWVILGGKLLPSAERKEGQVYQLVLEPVDSHPQLSGEHRSSDIFEPEMGVYYDVGG